jgi:hypothetical protein
MTWHRQQEDRAPSVGFIGGGRKAAYRARLRAVVDRIRPAAAA